MGAHGPPMALPGPRIPKGRLKGSLVAVVSKKTLPVRVPQAPFYGPSRDADELPWAPLPPLGVTVSARPGLGGKSAGPGGNGVHQGWG